MSEDVGGLTFCVPPGWPTPPEGWVPPPGWQPDPTWGPVPAGWQFWRVDVVPPPTMAFPVPLPAAPTPARRRRVSRGWLIAAAIALVLLAVAAVQDPTPDPSASRLSASATPSAVPTTPPATASSAPPSPGASTDDVIAAAAPQTALALLGTIAVKGRAPKTGYARDEFGPAWTDTDRNGCDTRNDVLARDLTGETFRSGTHDCVVVTGRLYDPYTGRTIAFTKSDANAVQIDHVVSLSNAWQTGAFAWPYAKRLAFGNDPLNLLAVDGPANGQKSDSDAASWLPPNKSARCPMVARQTAAKAKYGLWVTAAERDAIARVLATCGGYVAPTGGNPTLAPVAGSPPASKPTAAPATPKPAGNCDPSYPDVCIPPPPPDLDCGDISYRRFRVVGDDPHGFDRDHDGIGCES